MTMDADAKAGYASSSPQRHRQVKSMTGNPTIKSLQAYALIRELILRGELLPGTRLVLTDLEERLNVGRGPIREAIMRLDRSGLIQNLPYKGAVVAALPGMREIQHIYDVRVQLECILAAEAMNLAGEKECAELETMLRGMEEGLSDGVRHLHPDREFHYALYRMAGMPHLLNTAAVLADHVEIFLNSRYCGVQDQKTLMEQLRDILQAFREKDAPRLCAALKKNILSSLELIRREMERTGKT